jgi:hypothetical protein
MQHEQGDMNRARCRNTKIFVMNNLKHMPVFSADRFWLYKMQSGRAASHNGAFGTSEWELFGLL